jgi:hypothetical protein
MYTFRYIHLFSLLLFLSVIAGCETAGTVKDVEQPVTGQSIVFGHVDVVIDGEIQEWGYGWSGVVSCCLMILPPDSNQAITYKIDEDGIFYWSLEPGEYQLLGFRFQKGTSSQVGIVGGRFTVPEDTDAMYIGNITINMMKGRYITVVEDNSKELVASYKSKFPDHTDHITTALLQLPDKLGNFSSVTNECSERWGVDCTGKYRGITPLTPSVATNKFIQTDSLTPVFSWQAAENKDVSYDLVIYDVANYSFSGIDERQMKGRMIAYEENISEPGFKLKTPLKENTKYYWSVRLRDGDVVSRWSTYSHFGFYVFYATSGYGQWFGFSTP